MVPKVLSTVFASSKWVKMPGVTTDARHEALKNACTILRLDLPSYVKVFASILDVPVREAQFFDWRMLFCYRARTGGFGGYPTWPNISKYTIPYHSYVQKIYCRYFGHRLKYYLQLIRIVVWWRHFSRILQISGG